MELIELLFQVFEKWGAIGLVSVALIYIFMNGSRERLKLSDALSIHTVKASELTKIQEDNAALSEERWHDRMERYEVSRTETTTLINSLQSELREVTNTNSYGKGVIDTITKTYKEYRDKAEADKVAMLGEIDLLKRQVAENKRTIQELLKSSALKDQLIAKKDERIAELGQENIILKAQLRALKEENNDKPQLPDEPSSKD